MLTAPPKFHNGIINYDLNMEKLIADGYKEVIYTEPTVELGEYQAFLYLRRKRKQILQVWS